MNVLELRGLDGSNPLGFLATLGALRAAVGAYGTAVKMDWRRGTIWYPRLHTEVDAAPAEFSQRIAQWLGSRWQDFSIEDPVSGKRYKDLNIATRMFRDLAQDEQSRERLDLLACLGSDATVEDFITDTDFRTMSGAGHQHYLESILQLGEQTSEEDLHRAMFEQWKYEDDLPYLRLDPKDDRRYALRWQDPSKQSKGFEIRTVRGANRLATEGLRLFPVIPCAGGARTVGFRRIERNVSWTWPIWERPVTLDVVRSLIALKELQTIQTRESTHNDRDVLLGRGITEAFRSRRITIGKMRNFTPARAV